jgi:hypothetical protein
VTHTYIKATSNQRSTTSRVASAAGRLRPNAETGQLRTRTSKIPAKPSTNENARFGLATPKRGILE